MGAARGACPQRGSVDYPVNNVPRTRTSRAVNAMLLRNSVQVRGKTQISSSEIMSLLAARLFDSDVVRQLFASGSRKLHHYDLMSRRPCRGVPWPLLAMASCNAHLRLRRAHPLADEEPRPVQAIRRH